MASKPKMLSSRQRLFLSLANSTRLSSDQEPPSSQRRLAEEAVRATPQKSSDPRVSVEKKEVKHEAKQLLFQKEVKNLFQKRDNEKNLKDLKNQMFRKPGLCQQEQDPDFKTKARNILKSGGKTNEKANIQKIEQISIVSNIVISDRVGSINFLNDNNELFNKNKQVVSSMPNSINLPNKRDLINKNMSEDFGIVSESISIISSEESHSKKKVEKRNVKTFLMQNNRENPDSMSELAGTLSNSKLKLVDKKNHFLKEKKKKVKTEQNSKLTSSLIKDCISRNAVRAKNGNFIFENLKLSDIHQKTGSENSFKNDPNQNSDKLVKLLDKLAVSEKKALDATTLFVDLKKNHKKVVQEKEKLNEEMTALKQKNKDLETQLKTSQTSESTLLEQIRSKKLEIASLHATLKFKDDLFTEMKEKNKNQPMSNDAAAKKISDLEETIAFKDHEINVYRQTIEEFEEMQNKPYQISDEVQDELVFLRKELELCQQTISVQDQTCHRLRTALLNCEKTLCELGANSTFPKRVDLSMEKMSSESAKPASVEERKLSEHSPKDSKVLDEDSESIVKRILSQLALKNEDAKDMLLIQELMKSLIQQLTEHIAALDRESKNLRQQVERTPQGKSLKNNFPHKV